MQKPVIFASIFFAILFIFCIVTAVYLLGKSKDEEAKAEQKLEKVTTEKTAELQNAGQELKLAIAKRDEALGAVQGFIEKAKESQKLAEECSTQLSKPSRLDNLKSTKIYAAGVVDSIKAVVPPSVLVSQCKTAPSLAEPETAPLPACALAPVDYSVVTGSASYDSIYFRTFLQNPGVEAKRVGGWQVINSMNTIPKYFVYRCQGSHEGIFEHGSEPPKGVEFCDRLDVYSEDGTRSTEYTLNPNSTDGSPLITRHNYTPEKLVAQRKWVRYHDANLYVLKVKGPLTFTCNDTPYWQAPPPRSGGSVAIQIPPKTDVYLSEDEKKLASKCRIHSVASFATNSIEKIVNYAGLCQEKNVTIFNFCESYVYTFSALLEYLLSVAIEIKDGKDVVGFIQNTTWYEDRLKYYASEIEIAANLKPGTFSKPGTQESTQQG